MFEGKKRIDVEFGTVGESEQIWTMSSLIEELRAKHLREKEEMFV